MTLPRWFSVAALYALTNSMMLTPCWPSAGPTGGAGVAAPAEICSLMTAASFLDLGGIEKTLVRTVRTPTVSCVSDLRDLIELQLDRGLPTEDGHQHLEALGVEVDLADGGRERRERAVHDLSLIHISEPTRQAEISYAVFCLK